MYTYVHVCIYIDIYEICKRNTAKTMISLRSHVKVLQVEKMKAKVKPFSCLPRKHKESGCIWHWMEVIGYIKSLQALFLQKEVKLSFRQTDIGS